MKNTVFVLFLLTFAVAASASWEVTPKDIVVNVGDSTSAHPIWPHGMVDYSGGIEFTSDQPDIASVSGSASFSKGITDILIVGLAPGTAHVMGYGGKTTLATITVVEPPILAASASPSAATQIAVGSTMPLTVTAVGWTPASYTWFSGQVGDRSAPMANETAATYVFHAMKLGENSLWAEARSPLGVGQVQFTVKVISRRRSSGR